jgi:hypothetical protein
VALEQCVGARSEAALVATPGSDPGLLEALAMDGKTLRGSVKAGARDGHLLSALSDRLLLAQVTVPHKTNEIGAVEALVAALALDGMLVTTDALLPQRRLAHTSLEQRCDYLMVDKEDQSATFSAIALLFADPRTSTSPASSLGLHASRIERRWLRASTELAGYFDWPGLAQVKYCVSNGR